MHASRNDATIERTRRVAEVLKRVGFSEVNHGKGGMGQMVGDRMVRQAVGQKCDCLMNNQK